MRSKRAGYSATGEPTISERSAAASPTWGRDFGEGGEGFVRVGEEAVQHSSQSSEWSGLRSILDAAPCPEPIPGIRAQNLYPGPIRNNIFSISHIRGLWHGVKRCARTGRQNRALELGSRAGPAQTEPGYLGLIRAEIPDQPRRDADHKVQADNIKRWGSISRPPPGTFRDVGLGAPLGGRPLEAAKDLEPGATY